VKIWTCKIGEVEPEKVPRAADSPMRDAVSAEYRRLTGEEPTFIFSGWGGELTEGERAVVDDTPIAEQLAIRRIRMESANDGELLAKMGTDAEKWATQFVLRFGGDKEALTGWFANAIEAGRSAGQRSE
jgi:hypothetical protein